MSDEGDRWRIKEFAARVGVQEVTLRAWERRYALLEPDRSAGGFRLYSRDDERRIRSMQAHMARGIATAQAAALAVSESALAIVAPTRPAELVDELADAAGAYDATRIELLLDAAFAPGREQGICDVVLPALVEIGRRWESAELTIAHEHFASHLVERRLLALARGSESGGGRLALLACPSGERHALGLLCFGALLADLGWRIAYLGADTPVDQIAAASDALQPDVVVLCAVQSRFLIESAAAIRRLGRERDTLLAGAGASADLAQRLEVGYAGRDPLGAARALAERGP